MNFNALKLLTLTTLALSSFAAAGCATDAGELSDERAAALELEEASEALSADDSVGIWTQTTWGVDDTVVAIRPQIHVFRDRTFAITYARCRGAELSGCETLSLADASALPEDTSGRQVPSASHVTRAVVREYGAPSTGTWSRGFRINPFPNQDLGIQLGGSPNQKSKAYWFYRPIVLSGATLAGGELSRRIYFASETTDSSGFQQVVGIFSSTKSPKHGPHIFRVSATPDARLHP